MQSIILAISIIIFIYVGLVSWIGYTTSTDANQAAYTIGFCTKTVPVKKILDGSHDKDLKYLYDYARLSEIVYENHDGGNTTKYRSWTKLDIKPRFYQDPEKINLSGLYYEVWKTERPNDKNLVSIVFKGTSSKNDWDTNFRWLRRVISQQFSDYYDQLNIIADDIISEINTQVKNEPVEITSAGHSLGGGMAQFMAYRIKKIKKVYAFNSSPVTGYYDIETAESLDQNKKGCRIYRIYESGEALTYIRKFLTILYPAPLFKTKDPAIIRVRFSFVVGRDVLYQHGIKVFCENLKKHT